MRAKIEPPHQKKKIPQGSNKTQTNPWAKKKEFQGKSLAENSENLQQQKGMAVTIKPGENQVG